MNNIIKKQHIQHLGDFANRVSTFIKPSMVEKEITKRQFLIRKHIITRERSEDEEIKFMYNQFKIDEVSKRLKTPTVVCYPMKFSTLTMGKLVRIRNRARMAVNSLFAPKQTTIQSQRDRHLCITRNKWKNSPSTYIL